MAQRHTSAGLVELLRTARAQGESQPSDGDLLRQFVAQRDEEAFAVLVRRHGAMVLGVCRRILGNAADAEDGFQATFLVLVRKAAALGGRAVLGDWLHGVARRIALDAMRTSARRRLKEQVMARPEAQGEAVRDDWLPLLDEELGRLGEKYRLPIVLCDLEGRSRREAAAQLGWPEGTVAGRQARGRSLLAGRLARRGVAPAIGGVTAAWLQPAPAAVPAALVAGTVKAACLLAAGPVTATGAISLKVAALVEGALQAMLLKKLKTIAAVAIVALTAMGLGYGVWAGGQPAGNREPAPPAAGQPSAPPGDQKAKPDAKQDDTKKPARLVITLDKKSYEVGEPIALTVRLTNVGSTPFDVRSTSDARGQYDLTFLFVVKNEKGETLKHPGANLFGAMSVIGGHEAIEPGKFYTREFLLNYRVPPLTPGAYSVHAVFQPGSSADRKDLRTQSEAVAFRIAATPPADVQGRVARLTKELQGGGESCRIAPLLGFTGHADAAAPLIGLFYGEPDSMDSVHALLHLDRELVKRALVASVKARGPRYRMLDFLMRPLQTKSEEMIALMTPWLDAQDGEARFAAVDGIALANRDKAPELFALLEKRLKDPLAKVRHRAASALGFYQDAAALKALKTVVRDPDAGVSEQATIAVGWVAKAAPADSGLRKESVAVLRDLAGSTGRSAEQARYWLRQVEEK